ncbi:neuraminidase [Sarocladium strictum]
MAPNTQALAIPSATVQCHASNILQLPDKTLLCTWFGGSQEGLPDICIWLSRFAPGAKEWSPAQKISSDENRSCQNPVLFRAPNTGYLWLFHTSQDGGNQDGCLVMARTSSDEGKTWSDAKYPLKGQTGVFVRQPVVVLNDGTWVLPVFYCRATPGYRWIGNNDIAGVFYSKDNGETWTESLVPESLGCVHMNIIAPSANDTNFVAVYRSRWADNIYRSTSSDGINWTPPKATVLPNPNSGICAARLSSGAIAIVFNRSAAEADQQRREGLYDDITPESDKRVNQPAVGDKSAIWGTPRKTLTLGVSKDDGETWTQRVLEEGDGFCMTNNSIEKTNRELSYPSILVEKTDGADVAHVGFTFHRQYIKYVRVEDPEAWVAQDPIA